MLTEQIKWYILITNDLKWLESQINKVNNKRLDSGLEPMRYFIPYLSTGNERFAVLRKFVFICSDKDTLIFLLKTINYQTTNKYAFLYRDRNRHTITVPYPMMQNFILSCYDYRGCINFTSSIDTKIFNRKVLLKHTVFKGQEAHVVGARYTKSGVLLTLGLQLIKGVLYLKINAREGDIDFIDGNKQILDPKDLILMIQEQLLPVLSRKVHRKCTQETVSKDISILNTISNYRHLSFEDTGLHQQLLSMMLICSHLQRDANWEKSLMEETKIEMSRSSSMIISESLCWLYTGIYVCTGNPEYRNIIKHYTQTKEVSENLLSYVRLIRKRKIK